MEVEVVLRVNPTTVLPGRFGEGFPGGSGSGYPDALSAKGGGGGGAEEEAKMHHQLREEMVEMEKHQTSPVQM